MRQKIILSILTVILLASCSPRNLSPVPEQSLALEDCALTSPSGFQTDAQCGVLTVPEDRANPNGRQIELHIAVIPAITRDPEPDALFLLAGGPGQPAIETFPTMLPLMFNIHEDRDIALALRESTAIPNWTEMLGSVPRQLSFSMQPTNSSIRRMLAYASKAALFGALL